MEGFAAMFRDTDWAMRIDQDSPVHHSRNLLAYAVELATHHAAGFYWRVVKPTMRFTRDAVAD
eukprot:15459339-Alexandrium_andersonii.AAC.1